MVEVFPIFNASIHIQELENYGWYTNLIYISTMYRMAFSGDSTLEEGKKI